MVSAVHATRQILASWLLLLVIGLLVVTYPFWAYLIVSGARPFVPLVGLAILIIRGITWYRARKGMVSRMTPD